MDIVELGGVGAAIVMASLVLVGRQMRQCNDHSRHVASAV